MPRTENNLTASQVKNAKCDGKIRKLADGGGLTLVVKGDAKYWWLRYRFAGNERTLSLGRYPQITLADARRAKDAAKQLLAQGTDPGASRQLEAEQRKEDSENTFSTVAREWYDQKHAMEVSESHAVRNWRRLELYTFPSLAKRPINEIQPPHIREVLDKIAKRGHLETAHRVKTLLSQVFRYAVTASKAQFDVTRDLNGYLPSSKVKHQPSLTTPNEVAELLKDIEAYQGQFAASKALKLSPLVFTRPPRLWGDSGLKLSQSDARCGV